MKGLARAAAIGVVAGIGGAVALKVTLVYGGFPDFRGAFWYPGHLIREGLSPYLTHGPDEGSQCLYPPAVILLLGVPLSLLPFHTAAVIWTAFLIVCSAGSLYVMKVRDPRCYLAALLSLPFAGAIGFGNVTPLLILLVAVAYRLRDHPARSGIAIGAALAIKPFLLPMIFWGRRRGTIAVICAGVLVALSWTAIGFRGVHGYLHLISDAASVGGPHGASVYALALQLNATSRIALLASVAAAIVVIILGKASFNAVVLASLLNSPVTWQAYFALLYIVVAAHSPRFSPRWLIGLAYAPLVLNTGGPRPL